MPSTPMPGQLKAVPQSPATHDRAGSAWTVWLEALATDAEVALGAALAYEMLDPKGREAFLEALEHDARGSSVPRVALFAPLLAVEADLARRERIQLAMGEDVGHQPATHPRALLGIAPNQERIVVTVRPVYLEFVRVTSCKFSLDRGFEWVRDVPLMNSKDAPAPGTRVDEVVMDRVSLATAIDELALAIVALRRRTRQMPEMLRPLLDLFELPLSHHHER